jgi:virulence factor Mce-like protein
MQKQAPTLGRVMVMVAFALSCFGLLLFLWLSFGGAIPLKPQGYRFKVAVPDAAQLAIQADVRTAGVSVGKVVQKDLYPGPGNRTVATIELDRRFAPIHRNAVAILRQKTLLGETYLELTPGTRSAPSVPEGGYLGNAQVKQAVTLDQIFNALDPQTRSAFRIWQQSLASSFRGQGTGVNDALGNLPGFITNAADVVTVLDEQNQAVRRLLSNTGVVFNAISADTGKLHDLVVNSENTFGATAAQHEALARSFKLFPSFLDSTKSTLARLQTFAADADPLIKDLRPAARNLAPALHSTRLLAPDLLRFFQRLDPLIKVSKKGLPALGDTLKGLKPMLGQLGPFLEELNPILNWLEYNQGMTSSFFSQGITGVTATENPGANAPGTIGHYLRQFGPLGPETVGMYPIRPPFARGNAYPNGVSAFSGSKFSQFLEIASFDCTNAGGEKLPVDGPTGTKGCWTQDKLVFQGISQNQFPHVNAANYSK